jgi:hypothetical protein
VDISGIEPMLERFGREGPVMEGGISPHAIPDPVFNYHGVVTMLLGQQVACPRPAETWLSKAAWDARIAESRTLMSRALDQKQALDLLRQRPEMLKSLGTPNSKSWIVARSAQAEYVKVPAFWADSGTRPDEVPSPQTTVPHEPKERVVPYNHLLESVAPPHGVR